MTAIAEAPSFGDRLASLPALWVDRWTCKQELAAGQLLLDLEAAVQAAVEPDYYDLVHAFHARRERTRKGHVDRLRSASEAAHRDQHPRWRDLRVWWDMHEQTAWRLALSANWIAWKEAQKVAGVISSASKELAQEGRIGLLGAAYRFDPGRGLRFATYARWWVRSQITRSVDLTGRLIRIPGTAIELRRTAAPLREQGLTTEQIARELGVTVERIHDIDVRVDLLLDQPVPVDEYEPGRMGQDRRVELAEQPTVAQPLNRGAAEEKSCVMSAV